MAKNRKTNSFILLLLLIFLTFGCSVERVLYNGTIIEIKIVEEENIILLDVSKGNYKEDVIEVIIDNKTTYDNTSLELLEEGDFITVEGVMDNKILKGEIIGIIHSQ